MNRPADIPGTEGYAEDAPWLIQRYEAVSSIEKYRAVLHLFPAQPGRVLDLGAGTGVDAAWLAARGHAVTAVEPVAAFREAGMALHGDCGIDWIDDSLPALARLAQGPRSFDLVLASAVWHHLSPAERAAAMATVARLLAPGALFILSIRHGVAPPKRRVFDVKAGETVALAADHGLSVLFEAVTGSVQALNRRAGVSWTWLAFRATSERL